MRQKPALNIILFICYIKQTFLKDTGLHISF